ncbi:MAG: glycosyltransferase family 39 protein, partial [Sinomicrobium sp.]|nr:glycosyltransferase family 39 protein [Sinomicrobium sp.]
SESRYAEIAKEMYSGNDYLHPKLLDVHHYHKPPLTYYITALGYRIFGINEFGARFFLQVALIVQLIFVYHIALLLFSDKKTALHTSLIYFSLPLMLISVRNLTTDAYLNTFILGSIFFWLKHKAAIVKKSYFLYLFFIFLGLIMNTKGPVGMLFPLVFIASYSVIFKKKLVVNAHVIAGFAAFLIISLLWTVLLYIEDPSILDYFINDQILNRITSKSFDRGKPFWFYVVVLPPAVLPWLFPLVAGLKLRTGRHFKPDRITRLLVVNIAVMVLIFSIFNTKLILYVLPVSAIIAMLTAKCLVASGKKKLKAYNTFIMILTGVFLLALYLLPVLDATFSIRYLDLTGLTLLSLVAFRPGFRVIASGDPFRTSYFGYVFGAVMMLGSVIFFSSNDTKIHSLKSVTDFITDTLPDKSIVVYNYLLPSASFYTDKKIITINDGHNTVMRDLRFEKNSNCENYLINARNPSGMATLDSLFESGIVLVTRKKHQLRKNLLYLQQKLNHRKSFDTWIIYY